MELLRDIDRGGCSADFTSLVGKRFSYSSEKYPLRDFFLSIVQSHYSGIQSLAEIHRHISPDKTEPLYQLLYRHEEDPSFQSLFRRFIETEIAPHFPSRRVYVQKKPGVRMHLPMSTTVQFRTDEWYGHGKDVYNVWLPLTPAEGSSSLWIADHKDSLAEIRRIEKLKLGLRDINERLRRICRPVEMDAGQYLFFHSKTVHGSIPNETNYTRFSLDFRMLVDNTDSGRKALDTYYMPIGPETSKPVSNTRWTGTAYMDSRNGLSGRIGSGYQRLIIREYARQKGICIVGDEMEIQTMRHHPSLLHLSEGNDLENCVVLFSIDSLPPDREDRNRVFSTAEKHKTALFFANEDLCFPYQHSQEDIEKLHE